MTPTPEQIDAALAWVETGETGRWAGLDAQLRSLYRDQLEAWGKAHSLWDKGDIAAHILSAAYRAAREDSQRLDWAAEHAHEIIEVRKDGMKSGANFGFQCWGYWGDGTFCCHGMTWRQAIDAARFRQSAARQNGEGQST